jgi:hypothetical protein
LAARLLRAEFASRGAHGVDFSGRPAISDGGFPDAGFAARHLGSAVQFASETEFVTD